MNKFFAVMQLLIAAILAIASVATLVNLILIVPRPETISVVNTIIGQGVIIIFLSAMARILFRKGMVGLKSGASGENSSE